MNIKKILLSLVAGAVVAGAMSFAALAAGDTDEAGAVAKIGEEYYSTIEKAMADSADGEKIVIVKDVNNIPAPTKAGLYFKAAEGVKVTSRVNPPRFNAIDGVVTYEGFDFTTYDFGIGLFACFDGGHQLEGLEVVFKNCIFGGEKSVGIWGWATATAAESITLDGCKIADGSKLYFTFGKVNNIVLKNCDFSNYSAGGAIVQMPEYAGDITVTGCNFGNGFINFAPNQGDFERSIVIKNSVFNGEKAVTLHSNFTNSSINLDEVTFVKNTLGGITSAFMVAEGVDFQNVFEDAEVTFEDNATADGAEVEDFIVPANAVAKIGNTFYATLQDAIEAAVTGDTIKIFAGTYDAFTVPAGKSGLTFVGETDADGKNLVTIRTLEPDIDTQTKGIYVQAEEATFKNFDIVSGEELVKWLCSAIGATNNSVGLGHSNLNKLTVEGCNFKGNGNSKFAIWARACDITVIDCTIDGYIYGIETYATGADQKVIISGTEMTDIGNAIHTVNTVEGSKVAVENSTISAQQIHVSGASQMTIENSVIKNASIRAYNTLTLEITNSALYSCAFSTNDENCSISLSEVYVDNVNDVVEAGKTYNVDFVSYYATEDDYNNSENLSDVPELADAIYVEFVKADVKNGTDSDEQADLYNIVLTANGEIINRLNSVDLTFELTQALDTNGNKIGKNEFEIIASNDEVAVNAVDNSEVRYEFHYNGKDDVDTDTDSAIIIGQVKISGYGKYSFAVATANTNAAHATTLGDNIVDTFIPDGNTAVVSDGELVLDDSTTGVVLISVPTRELKIVIDFPNAVKVDNGYEYQDMKVVVSGGDLDEAIVIDLGANAPVLDLVTEVKTDAAVVVDYTAKNYVVTLTDVLCVNNSYNVEVSGAGYRTTRYTVTMTDAKTLNFWNNVKDNETAIEAGKKTAKTTFLAGDIVKDGKINVYDLSAVVSYFGEIELVGNNNAYAKYDLNRDGKIDSKDVAYVLVSWNN